MKSKVFIYLIIFFLLAFSTTNILQYGHKKAYYNNTLKEYEGLKNTYEENLEKDEQLEIGDNKARYFREQYNVSKEGEILFEFPEDDENFSS